MDIAYSIHTKSAKETQEFGQAVATSLTFPSIFCLHGDLGSGKTTFVQGFAKGLGLPSRLLSPTFIIVRRYVVRQKKLFFYHIDLYRTKSLKDLEGLGLSEIFSDTNSVIVIEWAERLGSLLPKKRTEINFTVTGEEERNITVKKYLN